MSCIHWWTDSDVRWVIQQWKRTFVVCNVASNIQSIILIYHRNSYWISSQSSDSYSRTIEKGDLSMTSDTFVQVGSAFGSGTSAEEQRHDKVAPEECHSSCGFKRLPKVRTRLRCRVGLGWRLLRHFQMFGIEMNRWILNNIDEISDPNYFISYDFKNCLILLILETNCINAETCHVLVPVEPHEAVAEVSRIGNV